MLLAGDIGGTKTILAIYSPEGGPRTPLAEATFPSANYPNLEAVVREFLGHGRRPVERAIFGVAGPVRLGRATTTNLPWVMDEAQLQAALVRAGAALKGLPRAEDYANTGLDAKLKEFKDELAKPNTPARRLLI